MSSSDSIDCANLIVDDRLQILYEEFINSANNSLNNEHSSTKYKTNLFWNETERLTE